MSRKASEEVEVWRLEEIRNQDDTAEVEYKEGSQDSNASKMGGDPATMETASIPPGYFTSSLFLGTYFAVAISLMAGVASYSFVAPLLNVINAEIGPDPNIVWVGYVYTLCGACTLTLVGRLSDLFGRRYFLIGGNLLALVGAVVCARSSSVPMLIGGMVIVSVATSTQIAFQFVMGELVPIGKRFLVMSTLFPWTLPLGGFGGVIANELANNTEQTWRWCFYILAMLDGLALVLYICFYFPPSFREVEARKSRMQVVKGFDTLGLVLFTGGFFVFLMGLTWGGKVYPWDSATVIATIVVGAVALASFIVFESKANLKVPYMPFRLFRNLRWVAMVACLAVGANQFYALAIVWPKCISSLWGITGWSYGLMSCIPSAGLIIGQICGALAASYISPKAILLTGTIGGTALLAAGACANEHNMNTVLGVLIPAFLLIGAQEALCGTFSTIALWDQRDIGSAGGLAGTLRSGASALGSVIYGVVWENVLASEIASRVPTAALKGGLPATSIPALLKSIEAGTSSANVPGMDSDISAAVTTAYRSAASIAARNVMLTTLAFGSISIICAFFTPQIDKSRAGIVARALHQHQKKAQNETSGEIEKGAEM